MLLKKGSKLNYTDKEGNVIPVIYLHAQSFRMGTVLAYGQRITVDMRRCLLRNQEKEWAA